MVNGRVSVSVDLKGNPCCVNCLAVGIFAVPNLMVVAFGRFSVVKIIIFVLLGLKESSHFLAHLFMYLSLLDPHSWVGLS